MTYQRVEAIGAATLYLGDCRDVLPTLPRPDAILSDPPYGQKAKTNVVTSMTSTNDGRAPRLTVTGARNHQRATSYPVGIVGDDHPFDPAALLDQSDQVLLWGAHKFGHRLPSGRWLAWDKVPNGKIRDQGDGEMAWTNVDRDAPMRIFRHLWDGLSIASGYETRVERRGAAAVARCHPTQKPVDLMSWCLQFLDLPEESLICDPYMGGGSSGISCILAGHRFIGIEIEPLYFEAACRRIEDAQRQGSLFGGAHG